MAELKNSRPSKSTAKNSGAKKPGPARKAASTASATSSAPASAAAKRSTAAQDLEQEVTARVGASIKVDFVAMSALSNVYRTAASVRNHMERSILSPDGLSWSAFTALFALWVRGEQEARHLAVECGVSKGTLTGIVSTLEARGLVERSAHPSDGRLVVVALTTRGRAVVKRLFPKFNQQESRVAAGLSAAEQKTLATLLVKVQGTIDSM